MAVKLFAEPASDRAFQATYDSDR